MGRRFEVAGRGNEDGVFDELTVITMVDVETGEDMVFFTFNRHAEEVAGD